MAADRLRRWRSRTRHRELGRRYRPLLAMLVVAIGAAALGWLAGRTIESPDAAARAAKAPPASLITATVQRRTLTTAVVVRGDIGYADPVKITLDADVGAGTSAGAGSAVVTGHIPAVGDKLSEGDVALEVSGRPVFLLQGDLPMYRAFTPGVTGDDVKQFEAALDRLGFRPGPVDGVYDQRTQDAVTRWYQAAGYSAVGPSADDTAKLAAAQNAVRSARGDLDAAQAALRAAGKPPSRSAVLAAQGAVLQAQTNLQQARQARDAAIAAASPADKTEVTRHQDALVAIAQNQLDQANAALAELTDPKDTTAQRTAVDDARARLDAATDALDTLRKTIGVRVPRGEVVFVPDLPRRVSAVGVKLGQAPDGPALSLSAQNLQITCAVGDADHALIKVGAAATFDEPTLGIDGTATVTSVAAAAGTSGAPAGSYAVTLTPHGGDPAKLAGTNVRVSVPIRSTHGAVLTVPLAALYSDASGVSKVRVVRGAGVTADVPVTVGLSADGYAQVTPVGEATLNEGDTVVVGQRQ